MVHPLDKQFSSYRPQTRLLSSRSFRDIEDSKKPAPKKPVKWILSHEKFHTGSERERTRDEYWDALNPEIHPLGHRWGKVLGQANWWLFSINTQRKHPFSTALSPSMRKFSIPALRIGRGHHPYKDPPSRMSRPSFRERILEKAALAQHRILNGKPALLIAKALKELDKRRKPRFSKGSVELARRVRKALRAKQKKEARLERGWKLRLPKLFSAHSAISKRENTDEQKQKGQSIGRSQ